MVHHEVLVQQQEQAPNTLYSSKLELFTLLPRRDKASTRTRMSQENDDLDDQCLQSVPYAPILNTENSTQQEVPIQTDNSPIVGNVATNERIETLEPSTCNNLVDSIVAVTSIPHVVNLVSVVVDLDHESSNDAVLLLKINTLTVLFYSTLGAAMPYLPVYYRLIGLTGFVHTIFC